MASSPTSSPTFHVCNLGCKVNRVESDSIAAALLQAGAHPVPLCEAQLLVVNTCAVTAEAEAKTRKAIRRLLKEAPEACVLVTGCAAVLDAKACTDLGERVIVAPLKADAVQTAFHILFSTPALSCVQTSPEGTLWTGGIRKGEGFPVRMALKIQDGCGHACSYCIVHVARGKSVSRPISDCLLEALHAFQAGISEVVLTGVDLGSYRHNASDLDTLLRQILAVMPETGSRLRLSSIEPMEFDPSVIRTVAQSKGRVCAHFHLPLQSGSDKVLSEMGRPYTTQEYAQVVATVRAACPQASLSTDVIVGFPGETEEDFRKTLAFCRQMRFSRMHVFRYSRRPGTPAAAREDQVDPQVAARRSRELRDLAETMRREDAAARTGTVERVVVERIGNSGAWGTSESYHQVFIPEVLFRPRQGELVPLLLEPCVAVCDDAPVPSDGTILLQGRPVPDCPTRPDMTPTR